MLNKKINITILAAKILLTFVKITPAKEKIKHNKNMNKIVFKGLVAESLILKAM